MESETIGLLIKVNEYGIRKIQIPHRRGGFKPEKRFWNIEINGVGGTIQFDTETTGGYDWYNREPMREETGVCNGLQIIV